MEQAYDLSNYGDIYGIFLNCLSFLKIRKSDPDKMEKLQETYDFERFKSEFDDIEKTGISIRVMRVFNEKYIYTVLVFMKIPKPKKKTLSDVLDDIKETVNLKTVKDFDKINILNIVIVANTISTNFRNSIKKHNSGIDDYAKIFNGISNDKRDDVPFIELFSFKELGYPIFEHSYVPHMELLDKKEIETIIDKYSIQKKEMPIILTSDITIKWLGGMHGGVVKIIRYGSVIGEEVVFKQIKAGVM